MKKIKKLLSIFLIILLLMNMILPVAIANSEINDIQNKANLYNEKTLNDSEEEINDNEIVKENKSLEKNTITTDINKQTNIENEKDSNDKIEEDSSTENKIENNNSQNNSVSNNNIPNNNIQNNNIQNNNVQNNNKIDNNIIKENTTTNNIDKSNIEKNDSKDEKVEDNINEENIDMNEDYGIMLLDSGPSLSVNYRTHVQYVGWQNYVKDGAMSGTSGQALRLEGINIQLANAEKNLNIKYQVHVQNIGWQSWKKNGEMAGTSGQALRLEGIRICLEDSDAYSIMYRVHVQNVGWQGWKTDGEMAGTSGQSLRLEAIQIKIVPKQKKGKMYLDTPLRGSTYYASSNINVKGWKMANVSNTTIRAYIDNKEIGASSISYYNRTDVTKAILDYGTASQNPKAGFNFNVSASSLSNGNHTIKIVLYSGNTALNTISSIFKVDKNIHVNYRSHVQYEGWQGYVMDGKISGTSGKSYRVEALNINLINAPENGKILYRTHVQNIGWQAWKSNGEMAGTSAQGLRVEAIEIKLQNMEKYTVEYQVHIQDIGWSNWYIDGEMAGTFGKSKRIEAIRIRIVPHYKRNYKGIDVSQYNGNINWGFVKRDNVDFAFIRVGYRGYGKAGNFAEDAMFKRNIQAAKNAKVPVGVYFVTQAITDAEAIEEAKWVLQKIKDYNIEYPIALDIEEAGVQPGDIPRTQNLDKNTRTRLAKLFCQTIQNAGYMPIIYTNVMWANNKLNMSELSQYDTWIAHYKYDATSKPDYSGKYTIWQYSNSGNINGIFGNVDLNIGYKRYY